MNMVDGSHWQGMKKLKKHDKRSGEKGYNLNVYKPYTQQSVDGAKNSQGKEQMKHFGQTGKIIEAKDLSQFHALHDGILCY